ASSRPRLASRRDADPPAAVLFVAKLSLERDDSGWTQRLHQPVWRTSAVADVQTEVIPGSNGLFRLKMAFSSRWVARSRQNDSALGETKRVPSGSSVGNPTEALSRTPDQHPGQKHQCPANHHLDQAPPPRRVHVAVPDPSDQPKLDQYHHDCDPG